MIKKYNDMINEKFGFPDTIEIIKDYLIEFTLDKFQWWINRKGLANYSEEFMIYTEDIDPKIKNNENFPLEILRYKLSIVRESNLSSVGGNCFNFKLKKDKNYDENNGIIYRNKINTALEIKIYTGFKSVQIDQIKERIETTIMHELQHLYSAYKKIKKKIDPKNDLSEVIFTNILYGLAEKYANCDTFCDFLYAYYPFLTKKEYDAYISEFSLTRIKIKDDIPGYSLAKKFAKMDFEKLYGKIEKEFRLRYKNVEVDQIPRNLIKKTLLDWYYYKINKKDWLEKYRLNFIDFIKLLHDDLKSKFEKFDKKSDKFFYGSRIEKGG